MVNDEAGNTIAIEPGSLVDQLTKLLEWARAKDFHVGPYVRIDGLVVQVQDLRQAQRYGAPPAPPDEGPWKAVGYDPDKDGG